MATGTGVEGREVTERTHFVYRAYDHEGDLLYVGMSKAPKQRLAQHRAERAEWLPLVASWRVVGPFTPQKARAVEYEAAHTESPQFGYTSDLAAARKRITAASRRIHDSIYPMDRFAQDVEDVQAGRRSIESVHADWAEQQERTDRLTVSWAQANGLEWALPPDLAPVPA